MKVSNVPDIKEALTNEEIIFYDFLEDLKTYSEEEFTPIQVSLFWFFLVSKRLWGEEKKKSKKQITYCVPYAGGVRELSPGGKNILVQYCDLPKYLELAERIRAE